MFFKKLFITVIFFTGYAHADTQVRAVQEELRRRNMYFGDIDGQPTPELEKATKRYQQRKGFSQNGTEDHDTLRSLGLVPRNANEAPPKELAWPSEPVLKSDAKIDVVAEAEQIAEIAGVAPASIAPETILEAKLSKLASATRRSTPNASKSTTTQRTGSTQYLDTPNLQRFVAGYMKAVSRNNVRNELKFYADRVNYYSNGEVDRRIIERTLERYYKRWPSRKYTVEPVMTAARISSRGEIVLTLRVNFSLKNKGQKVRGQTENRLTINAATTDPRIVAIEERRVRL